MTRVVDWPLTTSEVRFEPSYGTRPPDFGRQAHEFMPPFWVCRITTPPLSERDRRRAESVLADIEGTAVVALHDPRCPVPFALRASAEAASEVPALTVVGMSEGDRSLGVRGTSGDTITEGDPLAFTLDGQRHYFKARAGLALDGTTQTLPVFIRPRRTVGGLGVAAQRFKPRAHFIIDATQLETVTRVDGFTPTTITGVEHWQRQSA